jgi:NTP pyrophosphatase (non-canonical NTP hydrolase)
MTISDLQQKQYLWLASVGWADKTTPLEDLALIAGEIGEAANECRGKTPTEQFGAELADIVLRVAGLAQKVGIDLEQEILTKMEINNVRGTRGRLK